MGRGQLAAPAKPEWGNFMTVEPNTLIETLQVGVPRIEVLLKNSDRSPLESVQLRGLRMARYEFRLRARVPTLLPPYLGSTLRGAFGHALKAICCSVEQYAFEHQTCSKCLLAPVCHYPSIFEPSAIASQRAIGGRQNDPPRPFVFQPPLPLSIEGNATKDESRSAWRRRHVSVPAGGRISFGLTLFGSAVEKLPLIAYAVELMARHGLGAARAPFDLEEVLDVEAGANGAPVYQPGMARIADVNLHPTTLGDLVDQRISQINHEDLLDLIFITPAWIQIKGTPQRTLTCEQLVKRLSWRLSQMFELYGSTSLRYDHRELIELSATVTTERTDSWTHRFERYSSHQQDKTPMHGIMGTITYRGAALRVLLPFLLAGEFLQIGKETAFGLGRYWVVG